MDDEICDKLRVMVNLTDEFVAPIDGIDGLLGKENILLLLYLWLDGCNNDCNDQCN